MLPMANNFLFFLYFFHMGFQSFIIININVKFNLNQCKYHEHEKEHVTLPFHIYVGEYKKGMKEFSGKD
jgi:hypothetical protein